MGKEKKEESWNDAMKNPQTWKFVGAMLILAIVAISCLLFYVVTMKTEFAMECEFSDWKEVPEHLEYPEALGGEWGMYPDKARCSVEGELPLNAFVVMVAERIT